MTHAYYDATDVERLLDYEGCIAAVSTAMAHMTAGSADQPLRTIIPIAPGNLFAQMPGHLPGKAFGAKIISAFADPAHLGRSTHRGVVILFDPTSGEMTCIADAGAVTEIRTAAASAMATATLARADARHLTVFGYGAQARSHIHAIATVRPLERVDIWGRDLVIAERFAARLSRETLLDVRAVRDPRTAAEAADIICTVTGASQPILFGEWVRPGAHVNVVGSSHAGPVEIDDALVIRSRFVADSRQSVLAAGAEFLVAKAAGLIDDTHIVAEIGEILLGRVAGRSSERDITVYKSLGHIAQDLASVAYVHERSLVFEPA